MAGSASSGAQSVGTGSGAGPSVIVVYALRPRARALVKAAFPRRKMRVVLTRTIEDFEAAFKGNLIDAAVVDVGAAQADTWRVAARARDYPSVPFFGLSAL